MIWGYHYFRKHPYTGWWFQLHLKNIRQNKASSANRGWNPTQLCRDYFINHEITIPITLPETNSSPLKIGHIRTGNTYDPTINFFRRPCLFQGGYVPFCGFETSHLPDIAAFKWWDKFWKIHIQWRVQTKNYPWNPTRKQLCLCTFLPLKIVKQASINGLHHLYFFFCTLRIIGPSNGRVWTCIAGVGVSK